ncbi:uncharacterized protein LOC143275329 isoform X3 [Babylonia areolata]|uniref:uncharacterized protein LOC143275329 isoform X3 n=1 Tax=Babylonia areolata TaxID=304850 RepID=UPI003FCF70DD
MEWTVVSCVVFATVLIIKAEPVDRSPQEENPLSPDPTALHDTSSTDRERTLLLLQDYVKQGDTVVKEQVKDLLSNLKEQLKEGDKLLKERIGEGLTHEEEERKEWDERLKEELDEDVDWLNERLAKGRRQVDKELAEGEEKANDEITELKKAFGKLRDSVSQWTQPALMEDVKDLKQQMSDFQEELNSTKHLLQTAQGQLETAQQEVRSLKASAVDTQGKLVTTQRKLKTAQDEIRSLKASDVDTQGKLVTTQRKLKTAQDEIRSLKASDVDTQGKLVTTQGKLQTAQDEIRSLKASDVDTQGKLVTTQRKLKTAQDEIRSLKASDVDTQRKLVTTQRKLKTAQDEIRSLKASDVDIQGKLQTAQDKISFLKTSDVGSSFIRWGNSKCPGNTSLVYSGVAGGARHGDSGGGSNYLCLVMQPQMDDTFKPSRQSYLHGAEYEGYGGRDDRDVVCSVCKATQATTLMIPATRSCPHGWTTQFRGYIMSEHWDHNGRSEHVCVDEEREFRQGEHSSKDLRAAEFFHVVTGCEGSLPCPPYVQDEVLTCVVCSV